MTGAPGANGVYGYPRGTNGSYGGAAYTGRLGNTVENLTVLPAAAAARHVLRFRRHRWQRRRGRSCRSAGSIHRRSIYIWSDVIPVLARTAAFSVDVRGGCIRIHALPAGYRIGMPHITRLGPLTVVGTMR